MSDVGLFLVDGSLVGLYTPELSYRNAVVEVRKVYHCSVDTNQSGERPPNGSNTPLDFAAFGQVIIAGSVDHS